ncbi:MAG: DUF2726 domain-containing protein [Patescibacteria group bacterium]
MLNTYLTLGGIIILLIAVYAFKEYFLAQEEEYDDFQTYKKKEFLLNIPERKFFENIQQIIPDNYVVFPQIVLGSIVNVNNSVRSFWTYQNKINRKTIDFVIFEKPYLKPVLAIEYDGKTHDSPKRQRRDYFVNNTLKSAGIKIIHIRHSDNINFEIIKENLNNI